MERRRAGTTGLEVSRLALGTMTWSRDTDEAEAGLLLDAFLDAGGTLVDTAASYAGGGAETLLGSLIQGFVSRKDVQIATKAGAVVSSLDTLLSTLDESLKRLETDHVDLFLVHAFDSETPLEETLHALEIAVQSGRARYVGISNFPGWATARASSLATRTPLAITEVEYSLAQRGVEREVLPAALALGLGILAWSPLGRGVLTGKYRNGIPVDSRAASDHLSGFVEPYLGSRVGAIVDALVTAADGLGRAPHEVALAWVRDSPGVTSAIVGARTVQQLASSLTAETVTLPGEIRDALAEVSNPPIGYPERR